MPQLRAREVEAGIDLAVDDDTAAETGPEGDHDRIFCASRRSGDGFRLGGGVGVVLRVNGDAPEQRGQIVRQRIIEKRDIVSVNHHSAHVVDGPGGRHARPADVRGGDAEIRHKGLGDRRHVGDDGVRASLGFGGGARFLYDGVVFVNDSDGDVRAAQVYSDIIHTGDRSFPFFTRRRATSFRYYYKEIRPGCQ